VVNKKSILWRLIFAVAGVVLCCAIYIVILKSNIDRALDKSLHQFIIRQNIRYSVAEKITRPYLLDPEGAWAVNTFGNIEWSPPFSEAEFSVGDYVAEGMELFPGFLDSKDVTINKVETHLGEGTICEDIDCRIYILNQKNSSRAIIWIN
jgi:hypothetical protein